MKSSRKNKKKHKSKRSKIKTKCDSKLPALNYEMLQQVKYVWTLKNPEEVIINNFGLLIRQEDFNTLKDLNWLNNDIINFYMNLIIERGKYKKYPNVYATNTFFYVKLMEEGHNGLKSWTKNIDIFSQDLFIIPIHNNNHWCLTIIDFRNKSISYYDSLRKTNKKCLNLIKSYLEEESLDKKHKAFDMSHWKLECVKNIPYQHNCNDCGVFVCMYAEYISANRKINFTQKDMPYFRKKMVYEILNSKIL